MQATGLIAVWNATLGELEEVETQLQVENYWRQLDNTDTVYVLEDYAFVDADALADTDHEELLECGWTVLQLTDNTIGANE